MSRATMAAATVVAGLGVAQPAEADVPQSLCANAYLKETGWQGWHCTSDTAASITLGTAGQTRRIKALKFRMYGHDTGHLCADAHVQDKSRQNQGWQGKTCVVADGTPVTVGTIEEGLRLEAIQLSTDTGICANAHMQKQGWQGWVCGGPDQTITVGVPGSLLRMEALRLTV